MAKQLDKPVWAIGALSKTVHFWRVISIICLRWFRMTPRWNKPMKDPQSLLRQRAFELCRNLVGPP